MVTKTLTDQYLELYNAPLNELVDEATRITGENFDNEVEFCSIVSAKTGKCTENCRYCAQSAHYRTNIQTHPIISLKDVRQSALDAKANGATRFSIVTSGKSPDREDFELLLEMVKTINEVEGLKSCASLGILDDEQMRALKEAGLTRYHHNLNTCKSYHDKVCNTHTYKSRVETINLSHKYNMEVCSGGIIGMGESGRQRIELAIELSELGPVSVPVNFLHPIEGTPFEVYKDAIDEGEILKTLAIYRIILPKTVLRYGGGRALRLSPENQELGIKMGVNALLVGNYLTTTGITPEQDKQLVRKAGMKLKK